MARGSVETASLPVIRRDAELPPAERWQAFERWGHLLMRAPWRFAATLAANPHNYTLRRWPPWSDNDDDFIWAITYMRTNGYRHKWGGSWWVQKNINSHYVWDNGYAVGLPTDPPNVSTILINRKSITEPAAYDACGGFQDELFRDPDSVREQRAVVELIESFGPISEKSVLDVGCGTGQFLRHAKPLHYVGIDPSWVMLQEHQHRHPGSAVVRCSLATFCPVVGAGQYDLVLSLFGTGSYLNDAELARIPLMLKPVGHAVTMFYANGYEPVQYKRPRVRIPPVAHRKWEPGLMPGTVITDVPNFVIVVTSSVEERT
jgi:SAM-dependent methyltransferase